MLRNELIDYLLRNGFFIIETDDDGFTILRHTEDFERKVIIDPDILLFRSTVARICSTARVTPMGGIENIPEYRVGN